MNRFGRDVSIREILDLVRHERDEGGDDDCAAFGDESRDLVDERFASS